MTEQHRLHHRVWRASEIPVLPTGNLETSQLMDKIKSNIGSPRKRHKYAKASRNVINDKIKSIKRIIITQSAV